MIDQPDHDQSGKGANLEELRSSTKMSEISFT